VKLRLLALLVLTGLAGCASGAPAGPAPASDQLTGAATALAIHAGSYRADQSLLARAEAELTRRCMAHRGFNYPTGHLGPGAGLGDDEEWRPNLQRRRAVGYGLAHAGPAAAEERERLLPPDQQAAYRHALDGDPTRRATLQLPSGRRFTIGATGCLAEARSQLYGDVVSAARVFYIPQEAFVAIYPQLAADPRLGAGMARWATCMAARGHRYPSTTAARDAASAAYDRTSGAAATRLERRIAVADGECALRTGLPTVIDQIGPGCAARLPAAERHDLLIATALRTAALRRTHSVVG
jgi:hypothetical protein